MIFYCPSCEREVDAAEGCTVFQSGGASWVRHDECGSEQEL